MDRRKERDEYEEYLYQRELSERNVQIYLIQVEKFWDFLGDRPISKRETVAYKNHMKDNGWKVTTINLYVVAVNSYLVFAGYEECVLKTERVQRRQCPDDVLSGQEYHKLLEYTKQRENEKYYCVEVAGKCNPKELLDVVWKDVEKFQKGAEHFDDITMMAITWHGGNYMEKTQKAKIENLGIFATFLEEELCAQGISDKTAIKLQMTVDEIYSNICYYSGADDVTMRVSVEKDITSEKNMVSLTFIDDGAPYNPLERPDPNVDELLEQRSQGGLGIYLVKKRMDKVEYIYEDGCNCLIVTKKDE